jgi:hypothetical protein
MDEVRLAVEKGYKVMQVLEVYKYQVTQFDPSTGKGGLFARYTDTFVRLKAEASGYPSWVTCTEDENRYVASFKAKESIDLDKACIRPDAAKRALAKLCLNSMWGKLTERNNRTKTRMISEPNELYRFLATPGIEVASLIFVSDSVVWASRRYTDEEKIPHLKHTNKVIGAYVTTGARIHLYKYLDRLQENAIYCGRDRT